MLRRSFWHASAHLGIERFACSELVPVVIETLRQAYPDLDTAAERIQKCVADEENHYWKVVDMGQTLFQQMRLKMPEGATVFPGENAFILHDTHGIPVEITEDLSKKHGLTVDKEKFLELKEEAKILSKSKSEFSLSSSSLDTTGLKDHSDKAKYSYQLDKNGSYIFPTINTKILAVFCDSERVNSISSSGSLVLEECQFFAEEGGQKCDKGVLEVNEVSVFEVSAVEKIGDLSVLHGEVIGNNNLAEGSRVRQRIHVDRRLALMRAHTATHLVNWALKRLGAGRGQRGSSIEEDSLRFDYATDDCAGEDDIVENVDSLIHSVISQEKHVVMEELPLKRALEIPQLQSDFKQGKEYPEVVRVVCVGDSLDDAVAVECCSGTHVLNTSSLIDFAVISDRSSARGVRRILALTGEKARQCWCYGKQVLVRLESLRDLPNGMENSDIHKEEIQWTRMPYQYNVRARKLLKLIKKKRKLKNDTLLVAED